MAYPDGQPSIFDEDAAEGLARRLQSGAAKARNALLLAASMLLVGDGISAVLRYRTYGMAPLFLLIIVELPLICAMVALSYWAKKQPFTAQLTGLAAFAVVQLFTHVLHMSIIQHSIFINILIAGLLFSGLRRAQVVQRSMKMRQRSSPGVLP